MRLIRVVLLLPFALVASGCIFCGYVEDRDTALISPEYEFLHAGPKPVRLATHTDPKQVNAVPFDGWVSFDEQFQPADIWIAPFAASRDAMHFQRLSDQKLTMEQLARKRDSDHYVKLDYIPMKTFEEAGGLRRIKLIYLDDKRAEGFGRFLTCIENNEYQFYITPAWAARGRSIEIHRLKPKNPAGSYFIHETETFTVTNPDAFPRINRSDAKVRLNNLNYIWAFPLDCATMPVGIVVNVLLIATGNFVVG